MTPTEPLPMVEAVRRTLEIAPRAEDGSCIAQVDLTLTTHLSLAPARLWPLLTEPGELAGWFGPVTGELREGGTFTGPQDARGRVLAVEAPHRLELHWSQARTEGPLRISLDPEDDGTTLLRLRRTAGLDPAQLERSGPGELALFWEIALLALASRTDGWRADCLITPPSPSAAWLRSEEGAEHVRAWAVRWAAEALAAGMDEAAVRQGEAETVRHYLSV